MGRNFSGILGLIAFSTTLIRGALAGEDPGAVSLTAVFMLFAFAALGWVLGSIAETTVVTSVRERFAAELAAAEASSKKRPNATT